MVEVKVPQIVTNTVSTVNDKAIKPAYSLVEAPINKAVEIGSNVGGAVNRGIVQPTYSGYTSVYNYIGSWLAFGRDTTVKGAVFARDTTVKSAVFARDTTVKTAVFTRDTTYSAVGAVVNTGKRTTSASVALVKRGGRAVQTTTQPAFNKVYNVYSAVYGKVNSVVASYVLVPTHKIVDALISRYNRLLGKNSNDKQVAKKDEKTK